MQQLFVLDQINPEVRPYDILRDIILHEDVHTVFQPIVDLNGRSIHGYEALIRGPENTEYFRPIALFDAAITHKLEVQLEIMCRKVSIREYAALGLSEKLFLNISPTALMNPDFKKGKTLQYLEEYEISPEQVVIEVTEQQKTHNYRLLAEAITHYRNMGFTVALDDLGDGYSGLRLWSELLPDFIKVDKHFISNIHNDRIKASFVASLHKMATASNCKIIAEGVEQGEELMMLQKIGISFAQGFWFARPTAVPVTALEADKFSLDTMSSHVARYAVNEVTDLSRIARQVEPQSTSMLVSEIVDYLQKNPELQLVPILKEGRPVGIINRHLFFNRLMASRFGVELYGKRPISSFLDDKVILVDINSELENVSQRLTSTPVPEQAFIITSDGRYHGVATVLDLLEIITEQKIENARHANPLTLLPGIVPTNKVIDRMLKEQQPFSVAYFDLDCFKPYNDYYGYEAGDRIIQLLADLIKKSYPYDHSLIGHIGGDDFIVVDSSSTHLENIENLLKRFAEQIPQYYEEAHLADGGINGIDRSGRLSFFHLVSVSVGVVPPDSVSSCISHIEIADLASEAKKIAKKQPGNSYFINRRAIIRV
ncbi:MAG: bifunctional diguanylate cyclase/phosphodiesterase [Pseudomonadota bacterium]